MSEPQYPPPPYHPVPMSPADERMWAMFGHLSAIASAFVALPFLGPLIIFLVFKDRSGFVRGHSAEALNMTISLLVYEIVLSVVCTLISIVTLGFNAGVFALTGIPALVALVFTVIAAVSANSGKVYRYPLVIRLVR